MLTSSAKNKGRNLQKRVVQEILDFFTCCGLTKDDVSSRSMGAQGCDILLSKAALACLNRLNIECKNQEKINIWQAFKQAQENAEKDNGYACVIFTRNREKAPLVTVELDFLLMLLHDRWVMMQDFDLKVDHYDKT